MYKAWTKKEWTAALRPVKPVWPTLLLSTVLLAAASTLYSLDPWVLRHLIDDGLVARNGRAVWIALLALVAIHSGRAGVLFAGNMAAAAAGQKTMLAIRTRLYRKLMRSPAKFYERKHVGDLMVLLNSDVEQIGVIGMDLAPTLLRTIFGGILILGFMLNLNWHLTLLVLPAIPLFIALKIRYQDSIETIAEKSRQTIGERASLANESMVGIFQAQLLGVERTFGRKFAAACIRAVRMSIAQRRLEVLYGMGSLAIMTVLSILALGVGGSFALKGWLTIGGYVAFYSYLVRLFEPMGSIVDIYMRLKIAQVSLRRMIDLEIEVPDAEPVSAPCGVSGSEELACSDLAFGYPGSGDVLKGLDLNVARGEAVAIMGPSGSGKSTLAKLLVRCYEAKAGHVSVDRQDAGVMTAAQLRRLVSLVPQNGVLFSGSLRENATLGVRECGDDRLNQLAYITCFDEVVSRFPRGWDQRISAGGEGLSGGEKQRLMLLRALLQDRPFVILDESTSALDRDLEEKLLDRVTGHLGDKGLILITHRPTTARRADRVIHFGMRENATETADSQQPEDYGALV